MYWVYILTNASRRSLYTGVTGNIVERMTQHRAGKGSAFAARYRINRLVYAECTDDVMDAIAREKQIKGWRREKKNALIESVNPGWEDLMEQI